jgi:hypothetical protein
LNTRGVAASAAHREPQLAMVVSHWQIGGIGTDGLCQWMA